MRGAILGNHLNHITALQMTSKQNFPESSMERRCLHPPRSLLKPKKFALVCFCSRSELNVLHFCLRSVFTFIFQGHMKVALLRLVSIWSQTIADRRSQIADDRKESCFHIIADDRKRSQSRLQPYISVSRNVKCTRALCSRQNLSKQHSGHRGGNFAQANLLLLLVLKPRHRQLQKRRKHWFWVRKIFVKRQKLGAFHTLLRELRVSDRTVTNINEHSGFVAKKRWIIWVRIKIIMGYVSIADRRTLVSIWSQDRKRSQTIADDRRRSQKIEHGSIFCDRLRSRSQDRSRSQTMQKWVSIWSQTIAELSAIYDLRFAIVCDHMETSLYRWSRNGKMRLQDLNLQPTMSENFRIHSGHHVYGLLKAGILARSAPLARLKIPSWRDGKAKASVKWLMRKGLEIPFLA